jgi:general secretion pathway protein D
MTKKLIWNTGLFFLLIGSFSSIAAQSIEEKKANLKDSESDLDHDTEQFLHQINQEIQFIHTHVQQLYDEVLRLYRENAPPAEYRSLLDQINQNKQQLYQLENRWRDLVTKDQQGEGYGLWHAPETTLEQLIIDYGSQDYVYLIPPEVGSIKLSVDSNLPIPRSSWREMLELILRQNGVAIRNLNPYLRQLYLIKEDNSNLRLITNNCQDLEVLPPDTRIGFVLSPEPSEVRRTFTILEKFINPNTTVLQALGRDILMIGRVADVQNLLRYYQFISANRGEKDYRLIPLYKTSPEEMAKILAAIFDQQESSIEVSSDRESSSSSRSGIDMNGLKVVMLENMAQGLFLVGTRAEVRKAEEIIRNVESQIGGARDREIFWYTVKHSAPEELADVLYRVYMLMMSSGTGFEEVVSPSGRVTEVAREPASSLAPEPVAGMLAQDGYYQAPGGGFVINPMPAEPGIFVESDPNEGRQNFIVDLKTGSIVMVVEADVLPKMKELIAKLDVPKKMVQIETLLFEKVLKKENTFGLNLLRIGENVAKNINRTGAIFNTVRIRDHDYDFDLEPSRLGICEFFLSRKKSDGGTPPFDLAYRFLLSQEDIQINSSPSILTINQTPATIAINEEISINQGNIFNDDSGSGKRGGRHSGDSYERKQYGITISVKPTIHLRQDHANDDEYDYVTLETDITFDTIPPGGHNDRPTVTRRHITNQVDIVDGETVILGGLRRKVSDDSKEAIPFIGELPGLGKLFSINTLKDASTEMFIFITPHIVKDPKEQLACLRQELLCIRPGDIPYFLECVEEAYRYEKSRFLEGSMTMLLGRPNPRLYVTDCCEAGEYDGS